MEFTKESFEEFVEKNIDAIVDAIFESNQEHAMEVADEDMAITDWRGEIKESTIDVCDDIIIDGVSLTYSAVMETKWKVWHIPSHDYYEPDEDDCEYVDGVLSDLCVTPSDDDEFCKCFGDLKL